MSILDEAIAAAGVDPRELHRLLMAGQQARTVELAKAFQDAGASARDAYERGRRAHSTVAAGFTNGGAPVLDAESHSRQAWQLLGQGGQDMEDTATFLKRSVTALDEAQSSSTSVLNQMIADLNAVASSLSGQVLPDAAAAAAARQQAIARAAGIVRTAHGQVQRIIDGYDRGLTRDAGELAGRGYAPAGTVPGASYAGGGGPLAAPGGVVPGSATDPYRGLSGPNGLLQAGDVAGGLVGAKLEADAHFRKGYGEFLKSSGQAGLDRIGTPSTVLDRNAFYSDRDWYQSRIQRGDDLVRSADKTARTSKVLPLKVGGALAVAGIGYDIANGKDPVQAAVAGGGGFAASVLAGAAIGSLIPVPGVGTAVGAVVGAGVGVFTSGMIDGLFEDGPDVFAAAGRGWESVTDTGAAIGGGVVSVGKGIAGLFD